MPNAMSARRVVLVSALSYLAAGLGGVGGVGRVLAAQGGAGPDGATAAAFAATHPGARLYLSGERVTTVYGEAYSTGATAEGSAAAFLEANAGLFATDAKSLSLESPLGDGVVGRGVVWQPELGAYRFTLVYAVQRRDGVPVFEADLRLLVRNEAGFPLVLTKSTVKDLRGFGVTPEMLAAVIPDGAAWGAATREDGGPAYGEFTPPELTVWAGPADAWAPPALALRFIATAGDREGAGYARTLFVVDAATGRTLLRRELVENATVTGTVQGFATTGDRSAESGPEAFVAMPYARVTSGSDATFTNSAGAFTLTTAQSGAFSVDAAVRGAWFRVFNRATGGVDGSVSLGAAPPYATPLLFQFNAAPAEQTQAEVNAYVSANLERDYVLAHNPSFPVIGTQTEFEVNVGLTQTCNAFYDGGSINFFGAGGGCANTAFSTIVYHEYGHHMVRVAGSGQGQYGEGYGDTIGMTIVDAPVTGIGFNTASPNSGIRSASNTVVYPCNGEIHSCGRLLSGCVWETRNRMTTAFASTYRDVISSLVINSVLLHQGDLVTPQVTIDFLTLDDSDGNIFNGTPHSAAIIGGFGQHQMLGDTLTFEYPAGRPRMVNPAGGTSFAVRVGGRLDPVSAAGGSLLYRSGGVGPFASVPLTGGAGGNYTATFPALPCGTQVQYYVSGQAAPGLVPAGTFTDPPTGASAAYKAPVASGTADAFVDDMEQDRGWTVGSATDNAASGVWGRTSSEETAAQPASNHTPGGTQCWVTDGRAGTGVGSFDVDNGSTTLTTPSLNLSPGSGTGLAGIGYWRWYSNIEGASPLADVFVVDISNDNGATWTNAETVGPSSGDVEGGWVYHEFLVSDFVAPTPQVRLRFIASDLGSGSIVEAAVDDFRAFRYTCPTAPACPPDWNRDGEVNGNDISDFINSWYGDIIGGTVVADFNADGETNGNDISDFINAWYGAVVNGGAC